ncbi:MAG: hypothetical protein SGILL_000074 [Bacillariaceae sp.]
MGLLTRVAHDSTTLSHVVVEEQKKQQFREQQDDVETDGAGAAVGVGVSHHSPSTNDSTSHLKAKLKSLLIKYNGCTKDSEVVDVVNQLAELNPNKERCSETDLFEGDFLTITAPTFPGRLKSSNKDEEDLVRYALGRLSFNIFQPQHLVCTLRSVRNPVHPRAETSKDGHQTFSYHFVLDIIIHTPDGDLPATMINEAFCYEHPDIHNKFMVTFTGGTLMPANELVNDTSKLKLWEATFQGAYQKADEERSYLGWFFQYFMKLLLGLTLPSDETKSAVLDHTFHFSMKRSPTGFMQVLYLDNDLRITKGNRGTIVVAERAVSMPPQ